MPTARVHIYFPMVLVSVPGVRLVPAVKSSKVPLTCETTILPVTLILGMLRHRLLPMLQIQGIACDWEPVSLPADFLSSDDQRLHLLRILQEACTNILKHAQATQVRLRTVVTDHQIVFGMGAVMELSKQQPVRDFARAWR